MAARKRPIRKQFMTTKDDEDLEGLLVFGYQCKQFRDDEKAMYIDQGRHLIPWMGDSSLLIDRYDGRGHLYDLHQYDASKVNSEDGLTDEDKRIEALCDEERYFELHTDISEKIMYEEEEMKRLNQAFDEAYDYGGYAAVGFSYDYGQTVEYTEGQSGQDDDYDDEEDDPYIIPEELQLPPDTNVPTSMKNAKIIEKTAKFVAAQGVQMEILIKTKQSENPLFDFLEHDAPLNAFYKHMRVMIKSGRYKPKEDLPEAEAQTSMPEGHEYLHPKLMKILQKEPEPELNSQDFLESVKSKLPAGQLSNSLYAKLVTNIKDGSSGRNSPILTRTVVSKKAVAEPAASVSPYSAEASVSPVPHQVLEPAATYIPPHSHTMSQPQPPGVYGPSETTLPPPPGMEPVTLPSAVVAAAQPPPPGTISPASIPPVPMQPETSGYIKSETGGYIEPETGGYIEPEAGGYIEPETGAYIEPEASGYIDVLNGAYSADNSYEEEEDVPPGVLLPPPDQQPIVDKMAAYVAKNGPDFEAVVRNKIDERFHFLNSWHVHNKYYEYRKNIYLKEFAANNVKVTITQTSQNAAGDTVVTKTTTTLANVNSQPSKGVSFSIKPKDNDGTALTGRKIMLYDSSDEEDEEGNKVQKRDAESDSSESRTDNGRAQEMSKAEKTQANPEEVERRNAEERSKDRISLVAREKVAAAGREKQIQLERKRRAAMFINMLKGTGPAEQSASGSGKSSVPSPGPAPSRDESSRDAISVGTSSPTNSPKISPRRSRSPSPVRPRSTSRANSITKSPSRTRSPARSSQSDRHRVRDSERRKQRNDVPRRSRSRTPPWRPRRSPSPRRRRFRSRSPPTAYSVVRRSRSKSASRKRSRTRSKSPPKHKKKRATRSRSRERSQLALSRVSPVRTKDKKSRKKSRSKSPSRKRKSRSPSKSRKAKSRSKSPTSSKKSKKSHKHKSRSPSKSKSKSSRSGSKSREGSVPRLMSIPEVNTPLSDRRYAARSHKKIYLDDSMQDDDVIIISPVKEDCASPVRPSVTASASSSYHPLSHITIPAEPAPPPAPPVAPPTPPPPAPPPAPPTAAPSSTFTLLPNSVGPSSNQPLPPVSKDLMTKVRAMLRASRAQILKEEGPLSLDD